MSWHFLERWVEKANQHSTLVGKFWITFLIVCRMVIVASVGDRVYNDEQSEFKCNTLQPGCTNVCFNRFSPISHLRFWSFQILFVATPSVMFVVYSAHKSKLKKTSSKKARISNDEDDDKSEKHVSGQKNENIDASISQLQSGSKKMKQFEVDFPVKRPSIEKKGKARGSSRNKNRNSSRSYPRDGDKDPQAFPRSTMIRLGKQLSDSERTKSWEEETTHRHQKRYSRNSRRGISSSNTSGVGTFDYRSKRGNDTRNQNNNNNSNGTPTFAWRQPTQNTQNQQNNEPGPQVPTAPTVDEGRPAQPTKRGLTDLIMWVPSNCDDEYHQNGANINAENAFTDTEALHNNGQPTAENISAYKHYVNEYSGHIFPSAPPQYPGIAFDSNSKPWISASRVSLAMDTIPLKNEKSKKVSDFRDEKFKPTNPLAMKAHIPAFAQHFRWYLANVFVRLCIEVGFLVLQVLLFGFHVPELYKCERRPCPNTVDCFISRPMEKTIFLWFMFLYSCICVALNLVEFVYLVYAYIKKQAQKRVSSSKSKKEVSLHPNKDSGLSRNGYNGLRGGWMKHDIDPVELDLAEYQFRQMNDDTSSIGSRPPNIGWGGRYTGRQVPQRKVIVSGSNAFTGSARDASRGDTSTRDMMAFELDSDDERDMIEMEIERIEQDEMDFQQDNDANPEDGLDGNDQVDAGDNCI
uniref:gap junction alpha-8 protein n=1 Tax=Ciona intestinalis TaxID=7719 RepID=UPI00089DD63F|nr:gap junction alpha-8 protein [Ciona intestinalis]|eukprot:XP_004227068.2 gap junction alpha-8 protein [Ciona intestinalis]